MSLNDLKQIGIAFLITATLVTLAILFPVYVVHVPGTSEVQHIRQPIWKPPVVKTGDRFRNASPAELERMKQDPVFSDVVEQVLANERVMPLRRSFFAFKGSQIRNDLGAVAGHVAILFVAFVIFKFVHRG